MKSNSTVISAFIYILFFLSSTFQSCKKLDIQIEKQPQNLFEEKFFATPQNISNELQAVVDDIKKQNDKYQFINEFSKKNGLPVWDKVLSNTTLVKKSRTGESNSSGTGRIEGNDSLEIFLIPLRAFDSSIKTYIACVKDSGKYKYDVYRRNYLTHLNITSDTV